MPTATRPFAADRIASFLARRVDRRGMLARSAVVGSALAVAPSDFILRPRTAYAAICRCSGSACDCGSQCCDGYTEFCCTISGRNRCPDGSLLGGWWKVEGSSFCGNGPRYYLDCNAPCNDCGCGSSGICSGSCSGTPCGCANGSCGNRKAGCTGFRYGQCNQATPCLGPIICRVVTCAPPWELDGSCTTAVRTDNNTRYHDAPCLRGDPVGSLDVVRRGPGGIFVAGWALDPDATGAIDVHVYLDGVAHNLGPAQRSRPDIGTQYPEWGDAHGYGAILPWSGEGTVKVCAYGINVGDGTSALLGCRDVAVSHSPFGALDLAARVSDGVRVAGWAIDPDTAEPVDIHVYLSGALFRIGTASLPRPDVARAVPGWGNARGFDVTLPWEGAGPVDACAYAINVGAGSDNTTLGCRRVGG